MTGLVDLCRFGTGAESSLTEHTELSQLKNSGAFRVRFDLDVEGEAVDEVTDDAATDEALEVFNVVEWKIDAIDFAQL